MVSVLRARERIVSLVYNRSQNSTSFLNEIFNYHCCEIESLTLFSFLYVNF